MLLINLAILQKELSIKPELTGGNLNCEPILEAVRLLPATPGQKYSCSCLYALQWAQRPDCAAYPEHLVCVGGGSTAAEFFEARGVNFLIFPAELDFALLVSELQEIFDAYHNLHNEFRLLLMTQMPMYMILDFCTSLMDNYVFLLDAKYNLLETNSLGAKEHSAAGKGQLSVIMDGIAEKIRAKCQEADPSDNPLAEYVPAENGLPEFYYSRFFDGTQHVATLVTAGTDAPFCDYSGYRMQYLANLLQPCMRGRYSPAVKPHGYIRKSIFSIIDNRGYQVDDLADNLSAIGWKPKDTYQLVYIRTGISDHRNTKTVSDYYRYENLFPDCIAATSAKYACAVIVIHNPPEELSAQTLNSLRDLMAQNRMECRISLPFDDFTQLKAHFDLVRSSLLDMGERRDSVSLYQDVMPGHVIAELNTVLPARALCHTAAVKLQEYDAKNGTELLHTLEKYLAYHRSIQKAGEALYIHRNTIIYRLKKIEQITGLSLNTTAEYLHLLLSCIVLRTLSQESGS